MVKEYPWYELVEGEELEQGDFIDDCEVIIPKYLPITSNVPATNIDDAPHEIIKQLAKSKGKRLRLLSPYKEKLAQAFAYYYMRVALPLDIPKFEKAKAIAPINISRKDP